ncbi:MAG: hypothetical protein WBZ31_06230 [Thiobacillus sp.]
MTTYIRNCTFAIECDKKWGDLSITKAPDIRFCHACQREIYFCRTDEQLREAIVLNRCVAIEFEEISGKNSYIVGMPDDIEDDLPIG